MKRRSAASFASEVKQELGENWIPGIYRTMILPTRTRSFHFQVLPRQARVEILHTLLGVELRVGKTRRLCPDLATARYLSVFARVGSKDVAVPYDITKVSGYADLLESSWQRMLILVGHFASGRSLAFQSRIKGLLLNEIRTDIIDAGPGTPIPKFHQSTKQRRR